MEKIKQEKWDGALGRMRYLVLDVDGTMTDSGIYYDDTGNEWKRFCTRDGEAIKIARKAGIKIIVITGRKCNATERRMKELGVDLLEQAVMNKYEYLADYLKRNNIRKEDVGYIGDDINDLKAMALAGFVGCPSDSCREVIARADYVSRVKGGYGAVRDVIEHYFRMTGQWDRGVGELY